MMPDIWAIMQSGNLFVYCVNNPVRWNDPSGLRINCKKNRTGGAEFTGAGRSSPRVNTNNARGAGGGGGSSNTNNKPSSSGTTGGGVNSTNKPIVRVVTGNKITETQNQPPNAIIRLVDQNGNIIRERHFGPDGRAIRDIDFTNHGNPARHPNVPHQHIWDWSQQVPRGSEDMFTP